MIGGFNPARLIGSKRSADFSNGERIKTDKDGSHGVYKREVSLKARERGLSHPQTFRDPHNPLTYAHSRVVLVSLSIAFMIHKQTFFHSSK